jgi:uncharacterized protein (TIGR02453 family)
VSTYFSDKTFRFLRGLARHNEREWFHAHKADWLAHVRDPALHLVADLQPALREVTAHFRADPKPVGGSLFRIQRDTRFANDKTPYKTHVGLRFFHERGREVEAPSFYLHVQPGHCFIGAGFWHPEPPTLRRLRQFIHDNPAAWTAATRSAPFKRRYALGGESLVRPPAGFPPDHPLIDDLKRKSFVAMAAIEDGVVVGPRLARTVGEHFRHLGPLVDYLCAGLDLEF